MSAEVTAEMTLAQLLALIVLSLRRPAEAAMRVQGLLRRPEARGLALAAVMALGAALGVAAELLFGLMTRIELGASVPPVKMALIQGGLMVYAAAVMTLFGRQFGGRGRFGDALSLVIWIEVVMIAGQIVQLALMVLFPLAAVMLSLVLIGLMFWLLVQFSAALHGFDNLFMVGAAVVVVFIGSALVFGALLLSLGIVPPFVTPSA